MERRLVNDLSGRSYRLVRLLGRGGQGAVYAIRGGKLAVKLLRGGKEEEQRQQLERQLAFVRRLSLDDIPIAKPLEMLRPPDVGYVMELMVDMKPIGNLSTPSGHTQSIAEWYGRGGGLRRRLRLLARCAEVLNQLHGKGLVFGDLSSNNVFVSSNAKYEELCLIDADNLRYQSSPGALSIHTRGYGAPEVVNGRSGVNSLTDAYSLATLVFETLSLVHPLKGDRVVFGEPDLLQDALAGLLPWVDHSEDNSNRASEDMGIPREIVLSPRLAELAQRNFQRGLNDPLQRPGVAEWAELLHGAADATLLCTECGGSFYYIRDSCPWCGAIRPAFVEMRILLCYPDHTGQVNLHPGILAGRTFGVAESVVLPRRLTEGRSDSIGHEDCLKIEAISSLGLRISSLDDKNYSLISRQDRRKEVSAQPITVYKPENWRLHLGPMDRQHRVVIFGLRKGGEE